MSTLYRYIYVFIVISLSLTACNGQAIQAQQTAPNIIQFEDLLGKPLNDERVISLLATNDCTGATQAQLCKDVGVALWLDTNQIVKEVYLYLNNNAGFVPYKGELPLALKFYDTLGAVEYKLMRQEAVGNLRNGTGKTNYAGSSPDHLHYWVKYEPYGFTVIYNSPFPDEDATIYAIVLYS